MRTNVDSEHSGFCRIHPANTLLTLLTPFYSNHPLIPPPIKSSSYWIGIFIAPCRFQLWWQAVPEPGRAQLKTRSTTGGNNPRKNKENKLTLNKHRLSIIISKLVFVWDYFRICIKLKRPTWVSRRFRDGTKCFPSNIFVCLRLLNGTVNMWLGACMCALCLFAFCG